MQTKKRFSGPVSLIATLGAGLMLTGCGLVPVGLASTEHTESPAPALPSDDSAPEPASNEPEPQTTGEDPEWLVPSATGWSVQFHSEDNMYQATLEDTGCDVTYRQTTGVLQAEQEGYEPVGAVDYLMESVGEQTGSTLVEEPTSPISIMAESGESFDFVTKRASFDAEQGNRTLRAGSAWIDDAELLVGISCPTDAWEAAQFDIGLFLAATSIDHA